MTATKPVPTAPLTRPHWALRMERAVVLLILGLSALVQLPVWPPNPLTIPWGPALAFGVAALVSWQWSGRWRDWAYAAVLAAVLVALPITNWIGLNGVLGAGLLLVALRRKDVWLAVPGALVAAVGVVLPDWPAAYADYLPDTGTDWPVINAFLGSTILIAVALVSLLTGTRGPQPASK